LKDEMIADSESSMGYRYFTFALIA